MDINKILSKLEKVKKTGTDRYQAACPAHDDKNPSLAIALSPEGKVLLKCHAGCLQKAVIESLKNLGAWDESRQYSGQPKKRIVAEYNYTDENGVLLYQCVRYEPKDFRQRQPGANGQWIWNLRGVKLVPYNLPGVIASKKGIIIVEGEKDADNLINLGICATTSAAGAGKWRNSYNQYFRGRAVYIIPDNDAPGAEHAHSIATQLNGTASKIKIIKLPSDREKYDISDWLSDGGDKKKLSDLIQQTPDWGHDSHKPEAPTPGHKSKPAKTPAPKNISSFIEWPDAKDNGMPLATIQNLKKLMEIYGITVRYNVISKRIEINIPGKTYTLDNAESCALGDIMSLAEQRRLPAKNLPEYLINIADENAYNPVALWVESKQWDGNDRISHLLKTLRPQQPKMSKLFLERWLVSGVAAVFEPMGISAQGVLVLQGKQGIGKTSWFKSLVGDHDEWSKEGCIINPNDRDSVKQATQYWLVELGELEATFRRSDQMSIRAFLTRSKDEFRKAYARGESLYPRRTVFGATVNEFQYQRDPDGSRRYWTIVCEGKLNFDHGLDAQQIWAQAYAMYKDGVKWWLSQDEIASLNEYNREFEASDPIEERILSCFDLAVNRNNPMTATDVLIELGYDKPNISQARSCSATLRKLLDEEPVRTSKGRVFNMPPAKHRSYH